MAHVSCTMHDETKNQKFGNLALFLRALLIGQRPAIQVSHSHIEIRSISQPRVVRSHQPESSSVSAPPVAQEKRHVAYQQGHIAQSRGWPTHPEEKRHPEKIERKLRCIQRLAHFIGVTNRQ